VLIATGGAERMNHSENAMSALLGSFNKDSFSAASKREAFMVFTRQPYPMTPSFLFSSDQYLVFEVKVRLNSAD
jgi:hypothetical protein